MSSWVGSCSNVSRRHSGPAPFDWWARISRASVITLKNDLAPRPTPPYSTTTIPPSSSDVMGPGLAGPLELLQTAKRQNMSGRVDVQKSEKMIKDHN